MAAVATLSGITHVYGNGVHALGPLDLTIEGGEFLSLLGPSGCGKSTALRIIAELLTPTAGTLTWPGGKPQIGFVFQDATLMPWASARDNVRLPLDLMRVPKTEGNARAEESLARVGLSGFAGAFPRALSGGMRMRVSIARALIAKPQLLLMDEPFAALDDMTREAINADLLNLWREEGLTVVFVTHSVTESTFLSTRIVTLSQRPGRVVESYAPSAPASRGAAWRRSPEFANEARQVSHGLTRALASNAA
jgi:NitT/TauT family transport system ATP-binding protein